MYFKIITSNLRRPRRSRGQSYEGCPRSPQYAHRSRSLSFDLRIGRGDGGLCIPPPPPPRRSQGFGRTLPVACSTRTLVPHRDLNSKHIYVYATIRNQLSAINLLCPTGRVIKR